MYNNKEYQRGSITQKIKPCSIEDIGQTIAFQRVKPQSKKKKKITLLPGRAYLHFLTSIISLLL